MKKSLKVFLSFLMMIVISMGIVGCYETKASSQQKEKSYTKQNLQMIDQAVGHPNLSNFTEKKMAVEIMELRDDPNLITYTYTKNMDGTFTFIGTTIGYGLPFSVQLTAPTYDEYVAGGGIQTIHQPEPNGLYMPEGLDATWIMLVDEKTGKPNPAYMEEKINVFRAKLPRRMLDDKTTPQDY